MAKSFFEQVKKKYKVPSPYSYCDKCSGYGPVIYFYPLIEILKVSGKTLRSAYTTTLGSKWQDEIGLCPDCLTPKNLEKCLRECKMPIREPK